jgi:23S rRNA U2552 (ribose-2'-O)-methylase RlmE/FtsJ
MLFALLPSANPDIIHNIQCSYAEPEVVVSSSLAYYLTSLKNTIHNHNSDWDTYRKYTNPYEYINTNIPDTNRCVANKRPLSRSYFKMLELVGEFKLVAEGFPKESRFAKILGSVPMRSFHLAEGPGGFIEALAELRSNPTDVYIGMTLQDEMNHNENIPAWKKSSHFLRNNPNVFLENGPSKTGDLLLTRNLAHCISQYGSSMDLITADGGFDFTADYQNQEVNISRLLFGQISYALCLQKQGGHFVLKMFDCFMEHTVDLLYILSAFYKEVYITKPNTSRYANSERYVVCKGFLFPNNERFVAKIYRCFVEAVSRPDDAIQRFLSCSVPLHFTSKLEEFNAIFGRQQIDTIQQTIDLIGSRHRREKIEQYIKTNTQKCVSWCVSHEIPYNSVNRKDTTTMRHDWW